MQTMKILHVIPGLANSSGPTRVVINVSERLVRLGCEVSIFHLTGRGYDRVLPKDPRVEVKGFPIDWSRRWGYSRSLGKALRETVAQFDIVHIHSVWMYPTVAAARACRRRSVPYILRPAGSFRPEALLGNRTLKSVYYRLFEKSHLDNAALVHAVSTVEAEELRNFGVCAPISVIPNGVNSPDVSRVKSREEARLRLGLQPKAKVVLYLGRLHPIKGLDILTAVFASVLRRLPDAKLVIAGPAAPGYAREVAKMVKHHDIEEQTILTGEVRGWDKWAAYRAADVFVLPSRSENFGIVVAEAMACGVPVVVSKKTPWEDVETYNAGCWVNPEPDEVAKSIIEILENPDLARQMGENGRALVREKYTWDTLAKRMLRVYENIVAGRDPNAALDVCE